MAKDEHREDNYYQDEMLARNPLADAAMAQEADAICDIVKKILENPDCEIEKSTCTKMLKQILMPIRRILILNVTKRILDIRTALAVRIFIRGRLPSKPELNNFLSKFELVSLKKSKGKNVMYVANVGSYRAYDELCKMEHLPMNDETTLQFKPFQAGGPKLSVREKRLMLHGQQQSILQGEDQELGADQEGDFEESDDDKFDEDDLKDFTEDAEEEGAEEDEDCDNEDGEGVQGGEEGGETVHAEGKDGNGIQTEKEGSAERGDNTGVGGDGNIANETGDSKNNESGQENDEGGQGTDDSGKGNDEGGQGNDDGQGIHEGDQGNDESGQGIDEGRQGNDEGGQRNGGEQQAGDDDGEDIDESNMNEDDFEDW